MSRLKTSLLAATVIAATAMGGLAMAQPRPPMAGPPGGPDHGPRGGMMGGLASGAYDPAQLPEFKGKIAQYTLTPRGDVEGLILADGTEVQIPPNLRSGVVFSVKPGDAISIRGLKARAVPMIAAASITNDATGAVVAVTAPSRMEVTGKVKATLHTPRGDAGGVLLEDGTVVRMPPPEATRLAAMLAPGQTVTVRGEGIASPLGKTIGAREIGPSADKLTTIAGPRWHGRMGEMMGEHGPRPPHGPKPGDAPK